MAELTLHSSSDDVFSILSEEFPLIKNEVSSNESWLIDQSSLTSHSSTTSSYNEHLDYSDPLHLLAAAASQFLVDPIPVLLDTEEDLRSASNPSPTPISTTLLVEDIMLLQQLQSE